MTTPEDAEAMVALVKRFDTVRNRYAVGMVSVDDAGILGEVNDAIAALARLREADRAEIERLRADLEAMRRSENELGAAYLRIRSMLKAWETKPGGVDRFPVTEAALAKLLSDLEAADARVTALEADRVKVAVKPLVWFEVEKSRLGGKYTADGYTIRYIEGLWLVDFAGTSEQTWRHPTLEAAKAAANEDYKRRILSALEAVNAP